MPALEIKRPVAIKVIMTDQFRQQLISEAMEAIKSIEDNLHHMDSETQKQIQAVETSNPNQASLLTRQLEAEKERLIRMRGELEWRIKEVENVQNGAELPFRMLEGSVQLKVGDNFLEKVAKAEVVIKDWEIIEIREP
ncbi:MAG: YlqD family protein [bacterium]